MSHPSQTPPGNRPPNARVFRPFTGTGSAGQGNQTSATPPAVPRRPIRPFMGAQSAPVAPAEQQQPAPVMVAAPATMEPAVETVPVPPPTPRYYEPEPAPIAHEAWERYVAPEQEPQVQSALEPTIADVPVAAEPPLVRNSEITVEVPQIDDFELEAEPEPVAATQQTAARSAPPITVEVPTIPSEEAMAAIRDVAHEGDLWEAAYSTEPANQPSNDVEIDNASSDPVIAEVEAAFSETAASSSDSGTSDEALVAAATLEAIARRLRNGEVDIRPASGANMSREESALATVLAALLANQ